MLEDAELMEYAVKGGDEAWEAALAGHGSKAPKSVSLKAAAPDAAATAGSGPASGSGKHAKAPKALGGGAGGVDVAARVSAAVSSEGRVGKVDKVTRRPHLSLLFFFFFFLMLPLLAASVNY